jgi:release factor glutamine methyltransferase
MSTLSRQSPSAAAPAADPFRPTEYTGLLMQAIRSRAGAFGLDSGLDMGMGSGVLLATLGLLGVKRLVGVDIDPEAVKATGGLLQSLGLADRARLLRGSLWEPIGDERFDVIVTNLPHFAASEPSDPDHTPYWSMGGPNGRQLIDPFLDGLGSHLADDGMAFMTHNVFSGVAETAERLRRQGLKARPVLATAAILHPRKSKLLNSDVRAQYMGHGITRLGPYEFADVQILEIRRDA